MRGIYVLISYFIGMVVVLFLFTNCAHAPTPLTSKDTMLVCKQLCRGDVRAYEDDTIQCSCQNRGQ